MEENKHICIIKQKQSRTRINHDPIILKENSNKIPKGIKIPNTYNN